MYKLTKNPDSIIRVTDGAAIPRGHRWFREYENWLVGKDAAGEDLGTGPNTPEPADSEPVPTYEELRRAEYPPVGDQLDAIWKYLATQNPTGETADMLTDINAVKTKYPER